MRYLALVIAGFLFGSTAFADCVAQTPKYVQLMVLGCTEALAPTMEKIARGDVHFFKGEVTQTLAEDATRYAPRRIC